MRINLKQEELIEELMTDIRKKFPEVELIDVTESPDQTGKSRTSDGCMNNLCVYC